ncbi:MAG: hypothetical protein FOGNACKC_00614 [Anaerolineae bacterium]|nr:hypothetical protein [Anaerolineae bacterium]
MEIYGQAFALFLTLFVMMVGLIFTVVPPIPGTLVIWGAAIFYGLITGWDNLGWWAFGVLTLLMVVGIVADIAGGQFGARIGGASCLAIFLGTVSGFVLGVLGSLVGTPLIGCLAGLLGTLGGILLIERLRYKDWRTAISATKGFVAGNVIGMMARVTAGALMFGVFILRVYLGN